MKKNNSTVSQGSGESEGKGITEYGRPLFSLHFFLLSFEARISMLEESSARDDAIYSPWKMRAH